ncbi:hypothetical protein RHGRI_035527 [Rhododendron griersonianum]|uniref:histidine kinase n=1 Tax=Rhododendron griersonianum TaxID=479676 RepID=A0AAV6HJJ5_9ERIC|nr:hypothetical protein RHGRI_035527 [Rhododendron griersonianum]
MGDIVLIVEDLRSGSSCRICHEEEFESCKSLEAPCACSGTVKKFEPGYTAPAKISQLVDAVVTIRGSLEVPIRDMEIRNPESSAVAGEPMLETDYPECSSEANRRFTYCRTMAIIFMLLLLVRDLLAIVSGGTENYPFTLMTLLIIRACGIVLPMFVFIRIITTIQNSMSRPHQVAPVLFQALSTIPHLSQISFIGLDGLFFSYYYTDEDRISAVYTNNSSTKFANASSDWYTQPVNRDTGKLYGEAISTHPVITLDTSWVQEALNNTNGCANSIGIGWKNDKDLLLLNTAGIGGRAVVVSLGFQVNSLIDFFSGMDYYGGTLYLATKDGKSLAELGTNIPNARLVLVGDSVSFEMLDPISGSRIGYAGNVTCKPDAAYGTLRGSMLIIRKAKYAIYCSPIDIVGVRSVYVLALPQKGLESFVTKNLDVAFVLVILMVGGIVLSLVAFVVLIIRAARREMCLCAALIKQMEATQQAERKSLNKSLAFASASHDVRASLAGITGLIDMSRDQVAPGSDLDTNLKQMEENTRDLLGILNSILDASKIEAGKMQLEEEEFDLAQMLEDVVDFYHPVGMKKGLDVVLDPCDSSLSKLSTVKGDRTKIKQILCNLLSNAVKFTSEGHVVVRAWARKPDLGNSILSSSRNSPLRCVPCLFLKNDDAENGQESMNTIRENPNCVEFIFEVDDTGKGIPKEKQNSVFENYVQVKETSTDHTQDGTGLGLGIVQSLVRLMGGEIGIVDKEIGEKGTCFKFNIFLAVGEIDSNNINAREDDIESNGGYISSVSVQHSAGSSTRAFTSPKQETSHVVLFIQSETRQQILQKFMETLGVKVSSVKEWEQLPYTLKRVKQKMNGSYSSQSDSSSSLSRAVSRDNSKNVPLSALDGTDQIPPPLNRRTNLKKNSPNFTLLVIDTSGGPFRELSRAVAEFKRDLHDTCCRVIWIDKPGALGNIHSKGLDKDKMPSSDLIISKPFHGSRLHHAIMLLPEFGGTFRGNSISPGRGKQNPECQGSEKSSYGRGKGSLVVQKGVEIEEEEEGSKPLGGKRILVAEDNVVLRKVAVANVTALGAMVESCENGKKALELVCKGLSDQARKLDGAAAITTGSSLLPYDYILMDCEMPVMDGFEATRLIREEERDYGVHIPIIALTAHANGEEANRMMNAGMDFHLAKPLKRELLMEAILYIYSQQ